MVGRPMPRPSRTAPDSGSAPSCCLDIRIADAGSPAHDRLGRFVADTFRRRHDARVRHLLPHFLHIRDPLRDAHAVVGYRGGHEGRFYLEQYLDAPAETLIGLALGRPVSRGDLVEVGNLADSAPGLARLSIQATTNCLRGMGYHWVVFTGGQRLYNAFRRLGLRPRELAPADPGRLPADEARDWGRYYDDAPRVYFGSIEDGYRRLLGDRCAADTAPRRKVRA